ncbi:MAG: hypothetical protein GSR81_07625 [Desulfurococcales archaeon]|nr:hypothetical protein [Desulfurococcales archaeon]
MNCDKKKVLEKLVKHMNQSTSEALSMIRRNYELHPLTEESTPLSVILERYAASLLAPIFYYIRESSSCEELERLLTFIEKYRGLAPP